MPSPLPDDEKPPVKPTESLLSFLSAEGIDRALRGVGLTADETYRILGDIFRRGKNDATRLGAYDRLMERVQYALRLERVLSTEATREFTLTGHGPAPLHLQFTETSGLKLASDAARTEAALAEHLHETTPRLPGPAASVLDAEFTSLPEEIDNLPEEIDNES